MNTPPIHRRLLYVDDARHRITKSTVFLRDLLSPQFEIDEFDATGRFGHRMCRLESTRQYDAIVFFQLLPSLWRLRSFACPCVYVPMYDAEAFNPWQWRRLARLGVPVLSFSATLTRYLRSQGLSPLEACFFPEQVPEQPGDPRRVFLWERGAVTFQTVKRLFRPEDVDETLIRRLPGSPRVDEPDRSLYKVRELDSEPFRQREDYFQAIRDCGVFVAPRLKEGIGLSFLEAMSMGKCVVAHADATMDEYIQDGVNGWLVNMLDPPRLDASEVVRMQRTVLAERAARVARWKADASRIADWVGQWNRPPRPLGWRNAALFWAMWPLQALGDGRTLWRRWHHRKPGAGRLP